MTTGTSQHDYGLKVAVLSTIETFAQSVAGIAPSAAPAMTAAIVFGMAGNGAWLAYFIATLIMLLTALCINVYATRSSSPGALYSYAARGAGIYAGFTAGWSMLIAYILGVSCCSIQFAVFANELMKTFGLNPLPPVVFSLGCALLAAFIAVQNIKLSAELMLWLEVVSIGIICLLAGATVVHHHFQIDFNQLRLVGASGQGICLGLIMAMFAFVGFESSATLGEEAAMPLKEIPQAILSSVLLAGTFFIATTYAIVLGFSSIDVKLATCDTPLVVLSHNLGLSWLGKLTNVGAAVSFFACTLAMTNAASRILMTMAHQGFFHKVMARVSEKNKTPYVGVLVCLIAALTPMVILLGSGYGVMDVVGWLGTMATYGYLVAYGLVAGSMPFYLFRQSELKAKHALLSVITVLCVAAAFAGTMYPPPAAPYCWLPYVGLGYITAGLIYCRIMRGRARVADTLVDNAL